MNTELLTKLRDLRNGLFPNIETVNAVLDECIKLAGEQTEVEDFPPIPSMQEVIDHTDPASWPPKPSGLSDEVITEVKHNSWANPEFRAQTFLERMLRLRDDVSRWQGKCAVLRHENNKIRARLSAISKEA